MALLVLPISDDSVAPDWWGRTPLTVSAADDSDNAHDMVSTLLGLGACFEGVAGEFRQHEFGEVWIHWSGGGRTKLPFFASRLNHSRYVPLLN